MDKKQEKKLMELALELAKDVKTPEDLNRVLSVLL